MIDSCRSAGLQMHHISVFSFLPPCVQPPYSHSLIQRISLSLFLVSGFWFHVVCSHVLQRSISLLIPCLHSPFSSLVSVLFIAFLVQLIQLQPSSSVWSYQFPRCSPLIVQPNSTHISSLSLAFPSIHFLLISYFYFSAFIVSSSGRNSWPSIKGIRKN